MTLSAKCFRSGWIVDHVTTYVNSTSPFIFERNVAVNVPVIVVLKDDQYNIDLSSIEFYIDGWDATDASIISAVSGGYQIKYIPTINWYWNNRIHIRVEASNSEGISMTSYQYYFDIVAKKIGDSIEQAVLEISKETDWTSL